MNLKGNTIIITGGASGIGLAFAERFLANENEVIICGRDEKKLGNAKKLYPKLNIIQCDLSNADERVALCDTVVKDFPNVNVLLNNAGIQQRVDCKNIDWETCAQEIAINLEAPIHLSSLFIPHLSAQKESYIINVTSGLAFIPPIWVPVYGATKAGMHSFTFCLRQQLSDTPISVIEVIPPAVNTDLGGAGKHTFGADVNDFADAIFKGFEDNSNEIGFGDNLTMSLNPRQVREGLAIKIWENMARN